ncbi:ferric reduction oxidase 4 [Phtheirospermum japonicum]|uniref:ferric-chelate reductase (NADH) n=1 Tax=Phtheirospermum japonicum TaxID=374723 RepID=A0A830DB29_9LAMI|nr:ferric reduction oxidase 4 [Phtheirospermum japonicum]
MKFRAAWQLFLVMVFVGYMLIWIMLPNKTYKGSWTPKLNKQLNSTYFREQGTNLVLFSFPIMLIAALGCVYLHFQKKSNNSESSNSYFQSLKNPAMVLAPLGIVNAIELTFAAMFIALLIWSLANYLYVSFGHLHMHTPGEKVWHAKFRSVSLRLGYIGNTCWAFLFFPVTRGSSILPLIGLTSESSIKYHIWLGHLSMVLFALHSVGFVIYWWSMTHQMYLMLEWSSTYLSNLAGVIAFGLSLAMWGTSLDRVRRKMFELFFYAHHIYIPFVFLYMLHVGVGYLCMILPGIFLFLIDRYLRFLQSRRRARLVSARILPNGTMELTFAKNPGLCYSTTSTLFLHVPSVCKLQWHPFTITSSCDLETDKLSVVIKSQGSWTQKLYNQLSSSLDRLEVSTEGPYGPASSHFLRRESLVMVSGGSGITPFISIIREIISESRKPETKVPKILLITAFKNTADLTMLDLLLPMSNTTTPLDISKLQLQIEAYVTQEHEKPLDDTKSQIETKVFKPNPSDSPISAALGKNSWLWLGAIISSSFVMFLLLLGFVTRYHIYPVERRGDNYHYSYKILWDMFLVCASVFVATSAVFLWQKREISKEGKQVQNVDMLTPAMMSPSSWLCGAGADIELESLPSQSLVQSTSVHFGLRPDLKRILFECKEPDVGVLVSGPKSMRHDVAKICATGEENVDLCIRLCLGIMWIEFVTALRA